MSETKHSELLESLSALADGETEELELRRLLKVGKSGENVADQESEDLLRERWSQYQQIGAALRREPSQGVDISSAVMTAIQSEPRANPLARVFKPASQFAVAASVAAVALLGVQQYQLAQIETGPADAIIAEVEQLDTVNPVDYPPPAGFPYRPQTSAVSTGSEAPSVSNDVRVQIPFDRSAFQLHLEESVLQHSENAMEATQGIYPMLRAPVELQNE